MITAVIYGNLARGRGGPANCFLKNPSIRRVLVLDPGNGLSLPSGCEAFRCDGPVSGRTWNTLLSDVSTRYILYLFRADIRIDPHAPIIRTPDRVNAGLRPGFAVRAAPDGFEIGGPRVWTRTTKWL